MAQEWYGVRTFNGYEQKVIDSLKRQIEKEDMGNLISEIYLPSIKRYSFVRSKLKQKDELLFPGYFFVKMEMTNETLFFVRGVQYVTGYAGISSMKERPTAMEEHEIERMLEETNKVLIDLKEGDLIKVVNHDLYDGQIVKIKELKAENEEIVISLDEILGEEKTETIKFLQVEKA